MIHEIASSPSVVVPLYSICASPWPTRTTDRSWRFDPIRRIRTFWRESLATEDPVDPELAALYPSIQTRHTNRDDFEDKPVEASLQAGLIAAARAEGCALVVLGEELHDEAAALVVEGDRKQFDNPDWRNELASWMHTKYHGDGLTVSPVSLLAQRFVVSHFDVGDPIAERDRELSEQASLLVFVTPDDNEESWLAVGQALQRVLLVATAANAAVSYFNQPCQVEHLRSKLANLLPGQGIPQLVVRIGTAVALFHPSPRRSVDEVLTFTTFITDK
jgi:hypothetical protein